MLFFLCVCVCCLFLFSKNFFCFCFCSQRVFCLFLFSKSTVSTFMCLCILASVQLCVWLLLLFISESTTGQPQSWFHVVFSLQRVQCPLHASPYVSVSSGVCGFPKEYNRSATELVPRCFPPQRVQCPPPCVSVSISSVTESVPRFFPLRGQCPSVY